MLIGMLRRYEKPLVRDVIITLYAKEYDAKTIFFNVSGIDFENNTISGLSYKRGTWSPITTGFPDVVYNDLSSKLEYPYYDRLEKRGIPFTTHRLGINKFKMQKLMKEADDLNQYTIDTSVFESSVQLLEEIKQSKEVLLKPNRGHKGMGIYHLALTSNDQICSTIENSKQIFSPNQFTNYFSDHDFYSHYHIQRVIHSETPDRYPYVIRSYVGRDGQGKWRLFFHYAAIGLPNSRVVNVSAGSGISYIDPFLKNVFGESAAVKKRELTEAALHIAKRVQGFVTPYIDALGIDFGIDQSGQLVVFEVNAFPGKRPFEALAESITIPFCIYLANRVNV